MQITCPSCAARYILSPSQLGEKGRTVRCAKCSTTWFAEAPKNQVENDISKVEQAVPASFSSELRAQMDAPVTSFSLVPKRKKEKIGLPGFLGTSKNHSRKALIAASIIGLLLIAAISSFFFYPNSEKPLGLSHTQKSNYDGKGLNFVGVKAIAQGHDNSYSLTLKGSIQNNLKKPINLPALSAKLIDTKSNQAVEWVFHLSQSTLAPGETASFEINKSDLKFMSDQINLSFLLENP